MRSAAARSCSGPAPASGRARLLPAAGADRLGQRGQLVEPGGVPGAGVALAVDRGQRGVAERQVAPAARVAAALRAVRGVQQRGVHGRQLAGGPGGQLGAARHVGVAAAARGGEVLEASSGCGPRRGRGPRRPPSPRRRAAPARPRPGRRRSCPRRPRPGPPGSRCPRAAGASARRSAASRGARPPGRSAGRAGRTRSGVRSPGAARTSTASQAPARPPSPATTRPRSRSAVAPSAQRPTASRRSSPASGREASTTSTTCSRTGGHPPPAQSSPSGS